MTLSIPCILIDFCIVTSRTIMSRPVDGKRLLLVRLMQWHSKPMREQRERLQKPELRSVSLIKKSQKSSNFL